jgi:prolyl 4-hydroxylase
MSTSHLREKCVHVNDLSHCIDREPSTEPKLVFPVAGNSAVRVVHNVLTSTECIALIQNVEALGVSTPQLFDKSVRDCQRRHTLDIAMSEVMMPRLRPFLPEILVADGVRWSIRRFTHHWRYVKYERGGKFAPHWDGAKLLPNHKMTMLTVQVYLNDAFEGGATRFYMDYEAEQQSSHDIAYGSGQIMIDSEPTHAVTPKVGSVLVFDHAARSVLHDGQPVASGVKYIMRCDVMYEVIAEDIPRITLTASRGLCRTYCPSTAARMGTRNFIGQVWICWCALDSMGSCPECLTLMDGKDKVSEQQSSASITAAPGPYSSFSVPIEMPPSSSSCPGAGAEDESTDPAATIPLPPGNPWNIDHLTRSGDRSIVLVTGKRASGKDYVSSLLQTCLREEVGVSVYSTALGNINKRMFALENHLDYQRLLVDREYKEAHRMAMVEAHAARDMQDPLWCCGTVLRDFDQTGSNVLLVSDVRRLADLVAFQRHALGNGYKCITLRINCSDDARALRGWTPDIAKDTLPTETELDSSSMHWTACIDNSDPSASGNSLLLEWIKLTVMPRLFT